MLITSWSGSRSSHVASSAAAAVGHNNKVVSLSLCCGSKKKQDDQSAQRGFCDVTLCDGIIPTQCCHMRRSESFPQESLRHRGVVCVSSVYQSWILEDSCLFLGREPLIRTSRWTEQMLTDVACGSHVSSWINWNHQSQLVKQQSPVCIEW